MNLFIVGCFFLFGKRGYTYFLVFFPNCNAKSLETVLMIELGTSMVWEYMTLSTLKSQWNIFHIDILPANWFTIDFSEKGQWLMNRDENIFVFFFENLYWLVHPSSGRPRFEMFIIGKDYLSIGGDGVQKSPSSSHVKPSSSNEMGPYMEFITIIWYIYIYI